MSIIKTIIERTSLIASQPIRRIVVRPGATINTGGGGGGGVSSWDDLTDKPTEFPPEAHTHSVLDVNGLLGYFDNVDDTIAATNAAIDAGLAGINSALDGKQASLGFTPENAAQKGVAGGYAGLDGTGKVPAAQLPSYVDDVIEVSNFAALPGTGESGKIYVTVDNNKEFRWSGSVYVELVSSPGSTDAVAEGSVNLYFTTARVRATDLTGYVAAGSRIALAAGDTVLGAFGKLDKWVADLAAVAFSGSAGDLTAGTLPAARFDDTAHGARAGGTLHANVVAAGAAGFMTGADKTKLDGVAAGATVNAADASLRDRSTHTGTQSAATISDFSEAVDDRVATMVLAGTNMVITYNDAANTMTFDVVAGVRGGSAILNFGAAPGSSVAEITVSGQAAILSGSRIRAWIQGSTADHNAYEHSRVLPGRIGLGIENIVAGVGFTICAETELRMTGQVAVKWEWI